MFTVNILGLISPKDFVCMNEIRLSTSRSATLHNLTKMAIFYHKLDLIMIPWDSYESVVNVTGYLCK